MIPVHREYTVEISKDSSRALIRYRFEGKEQSQVEELDYVGEEEIYKRIDRGEPLILDNAYVDRFSLKAYRLSRKLDSRQKVVLRGFSAQDTLFGGTINLDFSNALIEGEVFSMEGSWVSHGDINFESARFKTRKTIFHNAHFPDAHVNFKNVNFESEEISFKNCHFGVGEKDFQYLKTDRGDLIFINADFSDGNVNFINSDFGKGSVSFKVARFGKGKVDFHFTRFKSANISFERCDFGEGRVDFRTVEFGSGRVNFNRTVFGIGDVSFDESTMDGGKFSFKRAYFPEGDISFEELGFENVDISFERTVFGKGKLSFYKSDFSELSLRFCPLNAYVDLRVNSSSLIDLSNTVVRDIIDMNPHEFTSRIDVLSLAGMRLMGRIYIDWHVSRVKQMIYAQKEGTFRIKAEQFRILKENFQNLGHYSDEDRAYVEFKRNESKAECSESIFKNRWNALYQYPLYLFKLLLFDRAGLYATSPVRVLITMFTFFVAFSIVYLVLILYSAADIVSTVDDQLGVVARSFYHSAITFLTIGYGDHYPFGSIRWVSSLEGFFGLFLMSYFTVAFVRKVLR